MNLKEKVYERLLDYATSKRTLLGDRILDIEEEQLYEITEEVIKDVDLAVAKLKKDIKNESFYIKNNGPEYLTVRQVNKLIEKRLEK